MYFDIESEFKKRSYYIKESIFFSRLLILCTILIFLVYFLFDGAWYGYFLVIILIISIPPIYIFIINKKDFKNSSNKFWNFKKERTIYRENMEKKDLEILLMICRKNKINTRAKIKEVINHYQSLIRGKFISSTTFLSFFAVIVSVLTLLDTKYNYITQEGIILVVSWLVFSLIIYVILKRLYNEVSALTRKEQIYVRIEELLSYIYFNDLVKK